jgi:hypothetical protein
MGDSILDDVLSRVPEKTLYHYTTQVGLLGIIDKEEIWATHTQYLNDTKEYQHAVDVITDVILQREVLASGDAKRVLRDMTEAARQAGSMNVCVCSFSEGRDSLSQWRSYCGGTSGFAIGFNPRHLVEVAKRAEFFLAPCIYDPGQQFALMEALVDRVVEQNVTRLHKGEKLVCENRGDYKDVMVPQGGSLLALLHRYAPILKDAAFSEEREWRIISRPIMCSNERFAYRAGASMLIPYYRVPISFSDQALKLDEVMVGPTPHAEASRLAAWGFLVKQGMEDVPVRSSAVPYRNW